MKNQETLKQEIVGFRLKPHIDRLMVDSILKYAMPIWNDNDKSVYFIRGHVAGSLVAKLKELQVLDLWFTPIYESEEVESDWVKEHHLEYYYKKGIMSDMEQKQTAVEWLEKQLDNLLELYPSEIQKVNSLFQQAKEMEKQQIIDTYEQGIEDGYWHPENGYNKKYESAEQYYEEKFKQ